MREAIFVLILGPGLVSSSAQGSTSPQGSSSSSGGNSGGPGPSWVSVAPSLKAEMGVWPLVVAAEGRHSKVFLKGAAALGGWCHRWLSS